MTNPIPEKWLESPIAPNDCPKLKQTKRCEWCKKKFGGRPTKSTGNLQFRGNVER